MIMKSRSIILLIGAMALNGIQTRASETVVYQNDFGGAGGSEWSHKTVSVTPIGARRFLGEFSNETVGLTLSNLPPHSAVSVAFDLFIILTWDGNSAGVGPDIWQMRLRDGTVLQRSTFSNLSENPNGEGQSFPDEYNPTNVTRFLPFKGATETNTLGFLWGASPKDAVYRIQKSFVHTNANLVLEFSGIGLQGIGDESWGLDNVSVTTLINIPPRLTASKLSVLHGFQYSIDGEIGRIYSIEVSEDLQRWTSLPDVTNTNTVNLFLDPTAKLAPVRFYRAKSK
jgi:hypothetical protein